MAFILFCLFFCISYGLNVFYLFNGIVPLLWIPYVLFKIVTGVYKPTALIMCLVAPVVWNLFFFFVGYISVKLGIYKYIAYFFNSSGAVFGGIMALISVALNVLSIQARTEFLTDLERFRKQGL